MSLFSLKSLRVGDLRPLSLELRPGECIALSGPSGSGKSRLLRAMADLDRHQGEMFLNDQSATKISAPDWRRQVSLLPAESAWWGQTTGEHFSSDCNVVMLRQLGFDSASMQWQVSRCSTGEKQRLALLRVLCNQPQVLLLDEPTASLDSDNVDKVEAMILSYLAKGHAAVWVSHDPAQRKRVASRHLEIKGKDVVEAVV
ncbi:MAG: ATP-binding cassette domain-containing protein [Gammaproteobacteria bacterium]|nr:ATP-binding cassette domain-containing protein [Gammaproteobacteria bacterium]